MRLRSHLVLLVLAAVLPVLAFSAVMAVVFIPLGVWVFGWAERYAKRTGKLKRAG